LLASALFFWLAAWRYSHVHLHTAHLDIDALSPKFAKTISLLLAGCSLLALVGLFITALF